jgi:hypothetical protein
MYVRMYVCMYVLVCLCFYVSTHTRARDETGLPQKKCIIADGQATIPQDNDNAEYMTQDYYKNIS